MSKTPNIKATLMLLTLSTFTTEATARGLREIGDSLTVMIPAYALGLAVKEDTDEGVSELWQSVLTTQLASEVLKKQPSKNVRITKKEIKKIHFQADIPQVHSVELHSYIKDMD